MPGAVELQTLGRQWALFAIFALGLASGGVALAYEVLWSRELLNLLGSTTRASAAILTAYMAGLAVGSWLAGRWSAAIGQPLWLYVVAEAVLAVYGVAFPDLLAQLVGVLPSATQSVGVLVVLLLLPTCLMGVALPALAAALQNCGADHPKYVAGLYGLNAFGGACAALAVGFGALPTFGLAASQNGVAAVGLLVAGAAAALSVRWLPLSPGAVTEAPSLSERSEGGRDQRMGRRSITASFNSRSHEKRIRGQPAF